LFGAGHSLCGLLVVALLIAAGCGEAVSARGPSIEGTVGTRDIRDPNDPDRDAPVQWAMLPGGGQGALHASPRHVVLIKVKNDTERTFRGGITAHLRSATSSILQVKMARSEPLAPGRTTYYHFDADGYGAYLWMSQKGTSKMEPFEMFLTLQTEDGAAIHHMAKLPATKSLYAGGNQFITFEPAKSAPDVSGKKPVQKDQWPRANSVLPGPPAIMRTQGEEVARYFYYSDKWNVAPRR